MADRYPIGPLLAFACVATVIVADGLWLASEVRPDVAAIIIEAKRGNGARDQLADHEARLRVLEDRGARG